MRFKTFRGVAAGGGGGSGSMAKRWEARTDPNVRLIARDFSEVDDSHVNGVDA